MNQSQTLKRIGIGALAGATTALLCLGLASGSMLAVLLFFISPVPLMVAGLGFGMKAALTGAVVAVTGTILFANGLVATLVALAIAGPALAAGYWLGLARPAGEIGGPANQVAWYPLADVLFVCALLTAVAFISVGALVGYGPELVGAMTANLVDQLQAGNPDLAFTAERTAELRNFLEAAVPVAQPFFWMLTLTLSVYIATAIAQRSGLMRRPRENWPLALRLPRSASFAFMAAIVVSFMSGGIGHIGGAFTGALGAGFVMAGLALLHARTRTITGRFPILLAAYLAILMTGFAAFVFMIAGMIGAGRHMPLSPAQPSSTRQND